MREIKFRGWHKTWSKEESDEHAGINGMQTVKGLYRGNTGKVHVHLWEWSDSCKPDDVELMQYTGLKDKNGKEIYEGDILRTLKGNKEVVIWVEDLGRFGRPYGKKGNQFYCLTVGDAQFLEVIGNIYEHPHLLTNPTDMQAGV